MFNHLTTTQKGMAFALVGYTAFAISDACVKWLSEQGYSIYQIIVTDTAIGAALMLCFAPLLGGLKSLNDRANFKIHGARIVFNTAVNLLFVFCVSHMPLVTLYSVIFSLPFVAALISIPVYKEKIGLHRWLSIVIGFSGVLIAFQPWKAESDFFMLGMALLNTIAIAFMFLAARALKGSSMLAIGFYPILGSCLITLPLALADFSAVEPLHFIPFVLSGILMSTGVICVSMGFKIADSAAITPLVYTEILWAILFGIWLFGDIPKEAELIGSVIIIMSGLYLIYRERKAHHLL